MKDHKIIKFFKLASYPGLLLLIRPVLYFIFSRRRDFSEYSSVDLTAIVFIFYSIIACIISLISIYKSKSKFGYNLISKTPLSLFFIYSILGIISIVWSVNFQLTGFRAFECISTALLIIAVIQNLFEYANIKFVISWSLAFCTWETIWNILRTTLWSLELNNILESSQMMSTTFFFIALYFTPKKWYNYLILIMSIFSMSTVAYIGMALGAISAFWIKGKSKIISLVASYIITITIIGVGPYDFLKNTIFFDKSDISIEETSGRNHLFDATLDSLEENPWGMGFFSAEPHVLYAKHLGAINAHNSIFSALLGLGYPGAIVLSAFFVSLIAITFSKYIPSEYRAILIGSLIVALAHCMGNPSIGSRVYGAWIPCMYIFTLICGTYLFGKHYEVAEIQK